MHLQFFVDSVVEKFPYSAIRSNYSCPNTQLRSIRTELVISVDSAGSGSELAGSTE